MGSPLSCRFAARNLSVTVLPNKTAARVVLHTDGNYEFPHSQGCPTAETALRSNCQPGGPPWGCGPTHMTHRPAAHQDHLGCLFQLLTLYHEDRFATQPSAVSNQATANLVQSGGTKRKVARATNANNGGILQGASISYRMSCTIQYTDTDATRMTSERSIATANALRESILK